MAPDCSCGYYDTSTNQLYTDSIIVYFNETASVPTDVFELQKYENYAEKSWNAYYRQGADPSNVQVVNTTYADGTTNSSMQLWVDPSTDHHLVVGAGIRTLRQDIKYGTFRSWMRSPQPFPKGTSLSMQLHYNVSQMIQLNMQNTDDPTEAWISNLMADDFADRTYGVNYTVLSNTSLPKSTPQPFNYFQVRMDWNQDSITFYAGENATRVINSDSSDFFNTPSPFEIKHWSIGDEYQMQGPPLNNRVSANVGWVRSFFNTSSMGSAQRETFDSSCHVSDACNVDDIAIRGSTAFPKSALDMWKPAGRDYTAVWPAIAIAAFCLCFTIIVALNTMFRRLILERKVKVPAPHSSTPPPVYESGDETSTSGTVFTGPSGTQTPWNGTEYSKHGTLVSSTPDETHPRSMEDEHLKDFDKTWRYKRAASNKPRSSTSGSGSDAAKDVKLLTPPESVKGDHITRIDLPAMPGEHDFDNGLHFRQDIATGDLFGDELKVTSVPDVHGKAKEIIAAEDQVKLNEEEAKTGVHVSTNETKPDDKGNPAAKVAAAPPARQRIDYLAGLVALCSLLVTAIHFALTFVPGLVFPAGFIHYPSEPWARKIIGPYVFNQVWVGLFFATSTRFLVMKYLKTGDLSNLAEKVVARVPRLFCPILAVVLLEYFLIDCGALHYLQYLPSVTWSTWAYTVEFESFGTFINEFLELIYLVPNAVPRIIFNYCIGVLWTIPVQLQGTWQALLGLIVIRECKTPWKRFFYYGINIIYNWYTLDWGTFFYFGLLLTDLDVIWKYRIWLYARPKIYYPLLTFFILCGFTGLTNDLISSWTPINFASIEHNIHLDLPSGLPLSQTDNGGFPAYYSPTIKHILFCLGFQAVVELSTVVQKALSNAIFVKIFPHIFTIYLLHGFIFWSLGAAVCVQFQRIGLPYWANSLLTAIICYSALAIAVNIVTPVIEVLGKDGAANAWRMANKKIPVVKWRSTLNPYPKSLLEKRTHALDEGFGDTIENAKDVQRSPSELKDIKEHIAEDNLHYIEQAIEKDDLQRVKSVGSKQLAKALSKD